MDSKEIKPVKPKETPPWIFIGRTDDKAEALILWPPDAKSQVTGKNLLLGRIECQKRKGKQRTRQLDGIIGSMNMSLKKFQETVKDQEAWHATVYGVTE